MVVDLMRIYTKTGDTGMTALFGGERVGKDNLRVEAYGSVDELNAIVGVALADDPGPPLDAMLMEIQSDLFLLGAELGSMPSRTARLPSRLLDESDVQRLEGYIDLLEADLSRLDTFILPGGSRQAASLHHARVVCRRAERRVVTLLREETRTSQTIAYLNRLSDLLFVAARTANRINGVADVPWPQDHNRRRNSR